MLWCRTCRPLVLTCEGSNSSQLTSPTESNEKYELYYHVLKNNRFLHTFLGKTGWSSTSDRNFMSFREWSTVKRAKRNKNLYYEWKITRLSQQPMQVLISSVIQQLSLSRTSRDPRHWSVTNLHKLSDQYHRALWNTHHIKLTLWHRLIN
jgi:hypothetical protein